MGASPLPGSPAGGPVVSATPLGPPAPSPLPGSPAGPPVVSATPLGPSAPASGWSVVFADAFGGLLHDRLGGSAPGADNAWLFNNQSSCSADGNIDAVDRFCPSQVSEQSDGLHLTAAYTQGVSPCAHQSGPCTYTSGRVLTSNDTTPATGFAWRIGAGESWAFQAVAKLAPQANGGDLPGGNDEGVWFSGGPPEPSWSQEFDLFEHWDYGACGASGTWPCLTGDNWVWQTNPFRVVAVVAPLEGFCQCDPSAAFHTYTAVINPDDSFGWYMDGRLIGTSPPPPSVQPVWMKMILSYALRVEQGGPDPVPAFSTPGQTRDFVVRSVSVYEDAADAGRDVQNGGVAPGTSLR